MSAGGKNETSLTAHASIETCSDALAGLKQERALDMKRSRNAKKSALIINRDIFSTMKQIRVPKSANDDIVVPFHIIAKLEELIEARELLM